MTGRPLRVVYVHPNSEIGGSDIALMRTLQALIGPAAVEATVILPGDGPLVSHLIKTGARVIFVPMRQLRTLPSPAYQLGYAWRLLPTVGRIGREIAGIAPDLVHTNSLYCLYGAWAARFAKTMHVWHVREIPPQLPGLTPGYAGMVRRLSRTVIAMSEACVAGLFGKTRPEHVVVMPDALDITQWVGNPDRCRIRRELGLGPQQPVVGFVARLDPWKGCDVFVKAAAIVAAQHPDAVFLVSGDAPDGFQPYANGLRRLVGELGLGERVRFLGWRYTLGDIPELMAALDVFCHTSITPEPFGLVLLEAMASGTPLIAARAGGPLEIVRDGVTGLLTAPGDAADLAAAMLRLLGSPDLRRDLAVAGRRRVEEEYSVSRFRDRLLGIYEAAIRN